jgi:hypothetical protein
MVAKLPNASVLAAIVVSGLVACGGGDHDGTSNAAPDARAEQVAEALPGRLENVSAALQERGDKVSVTTPQPRDTPRSLWPKAGLHVLTDDGPVNIFVYRSEGVVKQVLDPTRRYSLIFRDGVDQLGGCQRYVYFGHGPVPRIPDLCDRRGTEFIVEGLRQHT